MTTHKVIGRVVKISDRSAIRFFLVRLDDDEMAKEAVAQFAGPHSRIDVSTVEGGELEEMESDEVKETHQWWGLSR